MEVIVHDLNVNHVYQVLIDFHYKVLQLHHEMKGKAS